MKISDLKSNKRQVPKENRKAEQEKSAQARTLEFFHEKVRPLYKSKAKRRYRRHDYRKDVYRKSRTPPIIGSGNKASGFDKSFKNKMLCPSSREVLLKK